LPARPCGVMLRAVILSLATAASWGHREGVTPVQKVIQLLHEMIEKGKAEKQEEAVMFATYQQWCTDTAAEKQRAIAEANSALEQFAAGIQMDEAHAEKLGSEIAALDEQISVWNGDKKAASEVRAKEAETYRATHQDYTESLDALDRAISVLRKQSFDRAQAALTQVEAAKLIPPDARRVITAFLAQGDRVEQDPLDVSAPEANAYEFQSGGVIEMLEKLKDKFQDEKNDLEKQEMESKHAYEMLAQDLTEQVKAATQERTRHAQTKAQHLEAAASAKGEAADTTATRDTDTTFLADTTSTCKLKASDFEARQELRTEELAALDKAITVLSGNAVSGAAEKHLPGLVQVSSTALALRASTTSVVERASAFLQRQGEAVHSNVLLAVAEKVKEDPFSKVKKMIKDLIVRLMEEANEEAEHKGWCDTELKTNTVTRNAKTAQVDTLHSTIEELQAKLQKIAQDLQDTSAEITELSQAVAEATAQRTKEKEANAVTVKEAGEAQTAVAQAIEVLKEFYAGAAEATSLAQTDQPAIFDAPYTGMQGESGGVVGMLEVIQSDFGRLEAETSASEQEASKAHKKFLNESAVNKARLEKDVEHLNRRKTDREGDLNEATGDLTGAQEELDAALAYYEKLKPSCVDAGVTYEDRVGRRKEEIESLQEALRIMNGEDIA